MVRTARIPHVVPGVPHQVVTRGNNRRRLFSYPADYRRFISYLEESVADTKCQLHQLTLMPNHLHLLATPPEQDSLSKLMRLPLQRYAQHRNRCRNASGRLYEERFWSESITSDFDLAGYTFYCDANAYEAGLVDSPPDHIWSTCAIHYGMPERSRIPLALWTPSSWYASLGEDAPLRYRAGLLDFLEGRVPEWRYERLRVIESTASLKYRRRLERPDGTSAR